MKKNFLVLFLILLVPIKAFALIEVDITRGNLNPLPLAVSPLSIDENSLIKDHFTDLTVISLTDKSWIESNLLCIELRNRNMIVVNSSRDKSLKSQMRYANQIKSRFLMVIGDKEIANKEIELKELSTGKNIKTKLAIEEIYSELKSNG